MKTIPRHRVAGSSTISIAEAHSLCRLAADGQIEWGEIRRPCIAAFVEHGRFMDEGTATKIFEAFRKRPELIPLAPPPGAAA